MAGRAVELVSGAGSGYGYGSGYGSGSGSGYGYGYGSGSGYGAGYGSGYGFGYGYGSGAGYGSGSGSGAGYGYGSGAGYGAGYGSGYGFGYGYGYGYGSSAGYGSGYGYGYGYGSGYGYGYDEESTDYLRLAGKLLQVKRVLSIDNVELRREFVEAMGADRFFSQLNVQVAHQDIDGCGNPRRLCRIPLADTQAGYIQAVHVICPTTKREYYLGVPPTVKTCQEAVASTFKKSAKEYHPTRET